MPLPLNPESSQVDFQQKQLETYLDTNQTNNVIKFIVKHPSLVNKTLPSGYTPIEYSVSKGNKQLIDFFLLKHAKINSFESERPSLLDQLILKRDSDLLTKVFGKTFSNHLQQNFNQISLQSVSYQKNMQLIAYRQLKAIENESLKIRKEIEDKLDNHPIKELLFSENLFDLKAFFSTEQFSYEELFYAAAYSILKHKNRSFNLLYTLFGKELLSLQTTDLKNLYHIASIADNSSAIAFLREVGLESKEGFSTLFSPYHFALLHPTLESYFSLLKALYPYPKSSLQNSSDSKIYSPTELMILKAQLKDPLTPFTPEKNVFLVLQMMQLALSFFNSNSFSNINLAYFYEFSNLLVQTLSFFFSISQSLQKNEGSVYQKILRVLSQLTCLGVSVSFLTSKNSNIFINYFKVIKVLSFCFALKKASAVFFNFKHAYFLRPRQTLVASFKEIFFQACILKDHFFYSFKDLDLKIRTVKSSLYMRAVKNLSSDHLKKIDLKNFSLQKLLKLYLPFAHFEQKEIYKEIVRRIHPDRCKAHFSTEFCLSDKLTEIFQFFFKQKKIYK